MASTEDGFLANASGVLFDPDGWVSTSGPDGSKLHLRFKVQEDGRTLITDLLIGGGPPITADLLRKVQVGRIENTFAAATAVAKVFAEEHGEPPLRQQPDDDLTLGALRARLPSQAPASGTSRVRLTRPDGSDPETFYQQVAEAYRSAAAESRRPAAVLAEEASVPVTTVHRWIREARRRGFLPPGQKGKLG